MIKKICLLFLLLSAASVAGCGRKLRYGQLSNDRTVQVAFLPNGDIVAGSDVMRNNITFGTVRVIDSETWGAKELGSFDGGASDAISVSQDGKTVVLASNNAKILRTWNLENNQMQTLGEEIHPRDIAFISNESFVTAGYDAVRLWSLGSKSPNILLKCSGADLVTYSKTLNLLATSCDESNQDSLGNRIQLLTLPSGSVSVNQKLAGFRAQELVFSPEGKSLAFIGTNSDRDLEKTSDLRSIQLYDFDTNNIRFVGECAQGVRGIAFSPDGKQIAAQCDTDIVLWDLVSGQKRSVGNCGTRGGAIDIAFSFDGAVLAAACNYDGLAVVQIR